jgi:hypothetical protein
MTIGQLIESLLGKGCAVYGGYGDCTAFKTKGSNTKIYGSMLVNAGFHSSGNQLLYNGMTGEQLQADIYMGPTYYMRLKHMVKDKINYRARGPRTLLTRQTVQGRANDGGLRIGEMERDGVIAHGAAHFLNESFLVRGDEYYMAVCNKTGAISIYNKNKNLFLSPFADGPINFYNTMDGKMNIENVSRFGRSFSILRIPYALKLLIQELQVMNVQMRLITDDNVDQLMSMSYSKNIMDLTKKLDIFKDISEDEDISSNKETKETKEMNEFVQNYIRHVNMASNIKDNKIDMKSKINEVIEETPSDSLEIVYPETPESSEEIVETGPRTPSMSPSTTPESSEEIVERGPRTPSMSPSTTPESSEEIVERGPRTPSMTPSTIPDMEPIQMNDNLTLNFGEKEYNDFYESLPINSKKMIFNLPEKDRLFILKKTKLLKEKKLQTELESRQKAESEKINSPEEKSLLEYSEEKPNESPNESSNDSVNNSNSGEVKKIIM